MRPRDQSQIARQFVDDDLLIRSTSNPFRAGQATTHPLCAEPTSPPTSAASQIPLFHRCFAARPLFTDRRPCGTVRPSTVTGCGPHGRAWRGILPGGS